MEEDARVKNYHMAIIRGGESLEGRYTGNERTEVNEWMLTVPVLATWHVSDKVRLRVGPYVSFLVKKEFEGEAHEGYLRVGDPTGQRVELGNDATSWGSYDFRKICATCSMVSLSALTGGPFTASAFWRSELGHQ